MATPRVGGCCGEAIERQHEMMAIWRMHDGVRDGEWLVPLDVAPAMAERRLEALASTMTR